jgi:hypothetical protein
LEQVIKIPDIIGFTLEKGIELLQNEGFSVDNIFVTAPPRLRGVEYDKNCRIVKFKVLESGCIDLTVVKPL